PQAGHHGGFCGHKKLLARSQAGGGQAAVPADELSQRFRCKVQTPIFPRSQRQAEAAGALSPGLPHGLPAMNVLIVKLTSMGDLVQSLPALSDARRARPEVVFDWVVDEAFAEVPGWHPAVGRVIKTAHRRWRRQVRQSFREGEVQAFWRQLRGARYAAVIDAQSNIKSAVVTALTRGPTHGPDRASVREYPAHWVYGQRHAIPRDQHAVTRWRQLFAAALGYPMPATAADFGLAGRAWPEVPGL